MVRKICFRSKEVYCLSAKRELNRLASVFCRFFEPLWFWPRELRLRTIYSASGGIIDALDNYDIAVHCHGAGE